MWKNIACLIIGALAFSVFMDQPIFAASRDFSSVLISATTREIAMFDRSDGTIYYYNKSNGNILRVHKVNKLGASMVVNK